MFCINYQIFLKFYLTIESQYIINSVVDGFTVIKNFTRRGNMESKNKTVIMAIIDGILENLIWVNRVGQTVSLKDVISKSGQLTNGSMVDNLSRDDLLGAYTAYQIRRQTFAENAYNMSDKEIADKVKLFIFEEAHEQMSMVNRELGVAEKVVRKIA